MMFARSIHDLFFVSCRIVVRRGVWGRKSKLNTFMSHNTSHSDHSLINYAFVIFRLIHNEEHVTSVCKCVLLFLVSYSRYGVRSVHFIPIGAFWHILPVLFFCHCNYHPHRSICEAQELLRAGDFNFGDLNFLECKLDPNLKSWRVL